MTAEDWDEIFWRMVVAAQRAFDNRVPSVHLDDLEEGSAVGFYDMRALCRERPAALMRAGLTFSDDRLYQIANHTHRPTGQAHDDGRRSEDATGSSDGGSAGARGGCGDSPGELRANEGRHGDSCLPARESSGHSREGAALDGTDVEVKVDGQTTIAYTFDTEQCKP